MDRKIFIERAGVLQEVPDLKLSEKSLMATVKHIARRLGDDISEQKPILDSRLPDGSRVVAVIPPCSIHGITRTIRHRRSSLDFPMRPKATAALGRPGISRFPREVSTYVHGVFDRAGLWHTSRYRCTRCIQASEILVWRYPK